MAFALSACSGSSPSGPSPTPLPSFPSASTGTTISGSIGWASGGSGSTSGIRPDAGPAGIVVTIAGTSISATVDGNGKFTLTNVPGGTLTLEFNGPGISGTITIPNVVAGQTIELTLELSGSSVSLEAERRSSGNEEQVEGRIESIAAPNLVVAGRTIETDSNTRILMGSQSMTFADLAIGQRVHVKGQPGATSVLASLIDIQNTNTSLPVNVNGIITSVITGDATAFMFMVDSREVRGDTFTEFFGGSQFTDLANGARVEVKGQQGDGFVQALRIHVNDADDDDDDDDSTESEFTGELTSIGGTAPALTLVIGGTTVTTTGATQIRRRGDDLGFGALQVGQTIEVSGTLQSGGTVQAKKLTIESEDDDVDVEGVATAITGPCPGLTFTVGGITFMATSSTEFKKTSCAAVLALAGTNPELEVRGVMTGVATAQATRVEIDK